jgi:GT2 family glycosyltransferase
MSSPRVSVVIVTYNSASFLRCCLSSIRASAEHPDIETLVVDNGSTDGTVGLLENEFPWCRVLALATNLGFAAANNVGIRASAGRYVLLLNPDTSVEPDAIMQTARFLDSHPRAGAAGCRLVLPDGATQQSVRSFPTPWGVVAEASFLYLLFWRSRWLGRFQMGFFDYTASAEVDWLSGAFLMIRREVFDEIGLLDEQFFMYSEEMDFCRRLRERGWTVWYVAGSTTEHFWGGANDVSRRTVVWTNGSQLLYYRKHFRGLALKVLVVSKFIGLCLRVPLYFAVGCIGRSRFWFAKARYHAAALPLLIDPVWRYRPGEQRPSAPWPV